MKRNEQTSMNIPQQGMAPFFLGTFGTLFEANAVKTTTLVHSDKILIGQLLSMLDKQLVTALDARTLKEFTQARNVMWPKYVRSLRALGDTISNLMLESDVDTVSKESTESLSSVLEKQRDVFFGDTLTDQAVFTLWTLGKIRSLSRKIYAAGRVPKDKRAHDLVLLREYRLTSLWSQFHLDLAFAAIKFKKQIPEPIQELINDGLQAAVNAYAVMREALSLRQPAEEAIPLADLPWDEEDERLLAASMREANAFLDPSDS